MFLVKSGKTNDCNGTIAVTSFNEIRAGLNLVNIAIEFPVKPTCSCCLIKRCDRIYSKKGVGCISNAPYELSLEDFGLGFGDRQSRFQYRVGVETDRIDTLFD